MVCKRSLISYPSYDSISFMLCSNRFISLLWQQKEINLQGLLYNENRVFIALPYASSLNIIVVLCHYKNS